MCCVSKIILFLLLIKCKSTPPANKIWIVGFLSAQTIFWYRYRIIDRVLSNLRRITHTTITYTSAWSTHGYFQVLSHFFTNKICSFTHSRRWAKFSLKTISQCIMHDKRSVLKSATCEKSCGTDRSHMVNQNWNYILIARDCSVTVQWAV